LDAKSDNSEAGEISDDEYEVEQEISDDNNEEERTHGDKVDGCIDIDDGEAGVDDKYAVREERDEVGENESANDEDTNDEDFSHNEEDHMYHNEVNDENGDDENGEEPDNEQEEIYDE